MINEYFEADFNTVWPSAIVFQQPVKAHSQTFSSRAATCRPIRPLRNSPSSRWRPFPRRRSPAPCEPLWNASASNRIFQKMRRCRRSRSLFPILCELPELHWCMVMYSFRISLSCQSSHTSSQNGFTIKPAAVALDKVPPDSSCSGSGRSQLFGSNISHQCQRFGIDKSQTCC